MKGFFSCSFFVLRVCLRHVRHTLGLSDSLSDWCWLLHCKATTVCRLSDISGSFIWPASCFLLVRLVVLSLLKHQFPFWAACSDVIVSLLAPLFVKWCLRHKSVVYLLFYRCILYWLCLKWFYRYVCLYMKMYCRECVPLVYVSPFFKRVCVSGV